MAIAKSEPKSASSSDSEESSSRSTSPNAKPDPEESSGSESSEGESGSESSSESESDNESSSKDSDKMETDTTSNQQPTKKSSNVSFAQPQAFKPPPGFKSAKKQSSSSNVSSLLSNLSGKQVFHITAPSFLPLSKVKEVSLAKVMQGEPVLKHDGVNYGIPVESINQDEADGKTLLLHDPKSQSYYSTPAGSIPSYHVQEMISVPEDNGTGSLAVQDYEKPPRRQPKHLKMRFRPVGSRDGPLESIGSSSEESEAEKPTFKVSKGSTQDKDERKRKHNHTEGDKNQPEGVSRKKSKKHASKETGEGSSKMEVDEKAGKKSSKSRDEKKRKKTEKA